MHPRALLVAYYLIEEPGSEMRFLSVDVYDLCIGVRIHQPNVTMCTSLFGVIGASAITLLMFSFRRVHAARLTTRNTPPAR